MKKWRCNACGHVEKSEEVPKRCMICQLDSSAFEEVIKKPRRPRGKEKEKED